MLRLEQEMEEKEHVRRVQALEAAGALHEPGRLADYVEPSCSAGTTSKAEEEQDKVRRILIRLWSATNYAVLKGASLQLIQLLTRTECFKSNRYWNVFTKRLVWAGRKYLSLSGFWIGQGTGDDVFQGRVDAKTNSPDCRS